MQRSVFIMVNSPGPSASCSILVSLLLRNDNLPVVDLSGPLENSTLNNTLTLNYDFRSQASEWIAARDASISDLDTDSRIETLTASLESGLPNDGIFLSESTGCSIDDSSTCHIRSV